MTATSRGDAEEDAVIERALRVSVNELKNARATGSKYEPYDRAVAAGGVEAGEAGQTRQNIDHDEDDTELSEALQRSLLHEGANETPSHGEQASLDSGFGSEDDEDYRRALAESRSVHSSLQSRTAPPNQDAKAARPDSDDDEDEDEDGDEDLKRAMAESEKEHRSREEAVTRQQTEEEIVLEYVKKQSVLEEEHRKKRLEEEQQQQQQEHEKQQQSQQQQ